MWILTCIAGTLKNGFWSYISSLCRKSIYYRTNKAELIEDRLLIGNDNEGILIRREKLCSCNLIFLGLNLVYATIYQRLYSAWFSLHRFSNQGTNFKCQLCGNFKGMCWQHSRNTFLEQNSQDNCLGTVLLSLTVHIQNFPNIMLRYRKDENFNRVQVEWGDWWSKSTKPNSYSVSTEI